MACAEEMLSVWSEHERLSSSDSNGVMTFDLLAFLYYRLRTSSAKSPWAAISMPGYCHVCSGYTYGIFNESALGMSCWRMIGWESGDVLRHPRIVREHDMNVVYFNEHAFPKDYMLRAHALTDKNGWVIIHRHADHPHVWVDNSKPQMMRQSWFTEQRTWSARGAYIMMVLIGLVQWCATHDLRVPMVLRRFPFLPMNTAQLVSMGAFTPTEMRAVRLLLALQSSLSNLRQFRSWCSRWGRRNQIRNYDMIWQELGQVFRFRLRYHGSLVTKGDFRTMTVSDRIFVEAGAPPMLPNLGTIEWVDIAEPPLEYAPDVIDAALEEERLKL
jgi:hypothetical protein